MAEESPENPPSPQSLGEQTGNREVPSEVLPSIETKTPKVSLDGPDKQKQIEDLKDKLQKVEKQPSEESVSNKATTLPDYPVVYDKKYANIAASRYDYGPLQGHGQAIIEAAIENIPEGATVLEIGCSSGNFLNQLTNEFQKKNLNIIGLDINIEALPSAKEKHNNVLAGDAQQLPFKNESIDAILSLHTYEHVPDLGEAFAEIDRVLKPGGKAYIVVPPNLGGLETIRVAREELPENQSRGLRGWINALRYARKLHPSNLGGPLGGARDHAEKIISENGINLKVTGGMRRDLAFASLLVFEKPSQEEAISS